MKVTISDAHVRIFRAVEGAVRNTAHGHPRWHLTDDMARSIAKRATGTLTAAWPDVLAARSVSSDGANGYVVAASWPPPPRRRTTASAGRGASRLTRRSPLPRLWKELAKQVGTAKRAGQTERAEILIEVLRLIAKEQRRALVTGN